MQSLDFSRVGIGCNAFGSRIDAEATQAVVDAALDCGVTFFDTADSYGFGASEELLGKALGSRRSEVLIATKFGMDMNTGEPLTRWGSAAYINAAVDASLTRLGTDYIDLYQIHRPDPLVDITETLDALSSLVQAGKVRFIGSSNFSAWQAAQAHYVSIISGSEIFVTAQNEYSIYNRAAEDELVPAAEKLGFTILPYFPLAYGLLTGKYHRGVPAPAGSRLESQHHRLENADFDRIEALEAFARARDISLLDVAMGWLAAQPTVSSVIAGVTTADQVRANVVAAEWQPSLADIAELDQASPRPVTGFSYTTFA